MFHEQDCDRYLASIGRLASTRRVHRYTLKHFVAFMTERCVTDARQVTPGHLLQYRRSMEERGFAPKTVAGELGRLRIYFAFLERERIIFVSPASGLRMPRNLCGCRRAVAEEELREVLDSLRTDSPLAIRGKAILELAYSSALRPREVRALKIGDIDFAKGVLFIEQSKNRKDRLVPVGSVALGWVHHYLEVVRPAAIHEQEHPFVFVGHKTGEPLSREGLVWAVRQTFVHNGLQPLPLSAMRTSAATNLLDAGMNVVHIAQLLGHVNLRTTQRYLQTEQRKLAAVLDRSHPRIRHQAGGAVA
ncbi:MAG: tyrosine-type recombinase/integrase [Candidatus Thermoplasmatota archaeon]|nr:tyrosine-type recombinase/integrase [Candidatus Thermoplasmatota archaeon]